MVGRLSPQHFAFVVRLYSAAPSPSPEKGEGEPNFEKSAKLIALPLY
jgi:hypothetical protein